MSFGRHRKIVNEELLFQKKIVADLKDFASDLQKEIDKNGGEIEKPTAVEHDIVIQTDVLKDITETPRKNVLEKKEIKRMETRKRKKRVDKKEYTNIGVIGSTVVCKEFRAIVKKKGLQINNVLTDILHQWNTANYNL